MATTMANTAGLLKALGKQSEAETVYRTVGSRASPLASSHQRSHCGCCSLSRKGEAALLPPEAFQKEYTGV